MTDPVFFTVEGKYKSVVADSALDVDADPQLGPVTATVTLTPMLKVGDVILAVDATGGPVGYVPAPIVGRIDTDGQVKLRVDPDKPIEPFATFAALPAVGSTTLTYRVTSTDKHYHWDAVTAEYVETYGFQPIRLLDDTELLGLDGDLYYDVRFTNVQFNGGRGELSGFGFKAPGDGSTINLIEVGKVPGIPAPGVTRGPRGFSTYAVPITPGDPDSLYQWVDENGDNVGDPVELADVINVGWGAVSGKPAAIGAGATKAAARSAINAVTVVEFNGTSWPARPADAGPVVFVGGIAPGNEPPGVAGDVWIPTVEDGVVSTTWESITGKPAVIAAGADAAAARAVLGVDAEIAAAGIAKKLLAPSSYLSGYYYFAAASQPVTTSATLGNQTIRAGHWLVTQQVSISRLNAEVTVAGEAGSTFRIGIWAADGPGGMPGTLILDAGTIPGDGAVGVKEIILGSPLVLPPGLYYGGGAVQGAATTQPTMRTTNVTVSPGGPMTTVIPTAGYAMNGYLKTGVAAAFGAFSSPAPSSTPPARIGFKVT